MKFQTIRVELGDFRTIEVIPISDAHLGDECSDVSSLRSVVKYVLEAPNRFVILNGDLMNIALRNSKSNVYADRVRPSEQLAWARNEFKPLADEGRILAMGPGNHEDRIEKEVDLDMTYLLAKELGIEDRYADNSFVLFIKFGRSKNAFADRPKKLVYSFFVWHGAGGGATSGGTLNRLMKMSDTVVCDVYIMGHKHDPIAKPGTIFICDFPNQAVVEMPLSFLSANAFMDFGGYGQKFGYRPLSKHIVSAELNGRGRKLIKLHTGANLF